MSIDNKKELNEARRLIKTHTNGSHHAKVYKDEDGYHVEFFPNGEKQKNDDMTYYTHGHSPEDLEDAHGTAEQELKRMAKNIKTKIAEDSVALDSLRPDSMPVGNDPKSKVEYMTQAIGAMHAMKKDDFLKWFNDAMALIGQETRELPASANDAANKASINAKPAYAVPGVGGPSANEPMQRIAMVTPGQAMREDVEAMFEGQDLSEEFKEKASTLFEAAVNMRALQEVARLEEEYEQAFEESIKSIQEDLQNKIDSYLDYVVENWMKENQVAIESALRIEVMEDFIGGLKNLFVEHYIDVPSDKVDVVESLASKVTELEQKLDSVIVENVELKRDANLSQKEDLVEQLAEGLSLNQSEKFRSLAESLEFNGDLKTYAKKLSIVKENYFSSKTVNNSNIEEELYESDESQTLNIDPSVNMYVQAISRTVKK